MEFRIDRGAILKHEIVPAGFMRAYMRIARTGELTYVNPDGSKRIEIVTPGELFKKDSIDSFKMVPLTYLHPPGGLLTAENARVYQRGMTGHAAVIDGDFLGLVTTVTDKETIDAILSGAARQTSCGYHVTTRPRGDGKFDQIDRRGNHVAVVPLGRAGADVGFHVDDATNLWAQEPLVSSHQGVDEEFINAVLSRIDASEFVFRKEVIHLPTPEVKAPVTNETVTLRQVVIDGVGYNVDAGLASAIAKLQSALKDLMAENEGMTGASKTMDAQLQDMRKNLDTIVADKSRVDGELVAANAKLQQLETNRLDEAEVARRVEDVIAARIDESLNLWSLVLPTLRKDAPDYKPDYKLSPTLIRKLYLSKVIPDIKLDAADDNFIAGLWTGLKPKPKNEREDAIDKTRAHLDFVINHTHIDDVVTTGMSAIEKARQDAIAEIEAAGRAK